MDEQPRKPSEIIDELSMKLLTELEKCIDDFDNCDERLKKCEKMIKVLGGVCKTLRDTCKLRDEEVQSVKKEKEMEDISQKSTIEKVQILQGTLNYYKHLLPPDHPYRKSSS